MIPALRSLARPLSLISAHPKMFFLSTRRCAVAAGRVRDGHFVSRACRTSFSEATPRTSRNPPGESPSPSLPFLIFVRLSVRPSSPTSNNTASHFLSLLLLLLHLLRLFSANSPPSASASVGEGRKQDGAEEKKKPSSNFTCVSRRLCHSSQLPSSLSLSSPLPSLFNISLLGPPPPPFFL